MRVIEREEDSERLIHTLWEQMESSPSRTFFQRKMWCQKRTLELRSLRDEFVGLRSQRTAVAGGFVGVEYRTDGRMSR